MNLGGLPVARNLSIQCVLVYGSGLDSAVGSALSYESCITEKTIVTLQTDMQRCFCVRAHVLE